MKAIRIAILILSACFGCPAWGQQSAASDWTEFHRTNMKRSNPYENILNVSNAGNLQLLWTSPTSGGILSSPVVANGILYVGPGNPGVSAVGIYAVDANTGAFLWTYGSPFQDVIGSPAVANGTVYFGNTDTLNQNFFAVNAATGLAVWTYRTGNWVVSSPVTANGVVYTLSNDGNVYAFKASSGTKLWSYFTGNQQGWPNPTSSPALANGVLYVGSGSHDNSLYALNARTGSKLWSFTAGSLVTSSPSVANGFVFVGANDGHLYALDAQT